MTGVPMGRGSDSPVWPLPDVWRRRWTFGAPRRSAKGPDRRHAGVDMYAKRGSVVLAPEAGTIVNHYKFNGPLAHAVLIQSDSGPVLLLGEVEPGSWSEFGLGIGSRVAPGQPVARIGINPGGDQMLHFEMYRSGTRQNARWYAGQAPPPNLLDPTEYLKTAKALDQSDDSSVQDTTPGDADDPGDSHDHADEVDDPVDDQVDDQVDDIVDDPGQNHLPKTTGPSGSPIMAGLLAVGALYLISEFGDV